eukprot:11616217-Alexandrium_andersonii.AAC.1
MPDARTTAANMPGPTMTITRGLQDRSRTRQRAPVTRSPHVVQHETMLAKTPLYATATRVVRHMWQWATTWACSATARARPGA